jgi:hypothetical protein
MSSMKIAHFVPIGLQTWPPHAILVSDWSISKKTFLLKLLNHMNQNLVGSIYIYGRFCIKFPQSRMKGQRTSSLLTKKIICMPSTLFKSIFDLMIEPLGFKKKYKFSKSSEVL